MGKYTDLARRLKGRESHKVGLASPSNIINDNIDTIDSSIYSGISKPVSDRPEHTLNPSVVVEKSQAVASGSERHGRERAERVTRLRSTNLTNLTEGEEVWALVAPDTHRYTSLSRKEGGAPVALRCIHDTNPDACGVCSGYARWLIADEGRLRRAQADPDGVRREFWRAVRGGAS